MADIDPLNLLEGEMILSHRHRFIYIKTFKTASSSIEAALSAVCGPDDVITQATAAVMARRPNQIAQNWRLEHPDVPKRPFWRKLFGRPEKHFHPTVGYYEHMPAWRLRKYVGEEVWNSYYKFTFERNPWDRQVSWYSFKTRNVDPRPDFKRFNRSIRKAWVDNYDLYSIDGEVALDFVGKYEELEESFAEVLDRIGVEDVAVPRINVSTRRKDYRSYYDDEMAATIGDWYRREIDAFGYAF